MTISINNKNCLGNKLTARVSEWYRERSEELIQVKVYLFVVLASFLQH